MDKRTLIFIALVGATFLGVNLFFSHSQTKKNREELIRKEIVASHTQTKLREEVAKRKVPLSSLPLTEFYADSDGKTKIGKGITTQNSLLAMTWDLPLPKTVYISQDNQFKPLSLRTQDTVVGGAALYTAPEFTSLGITSLPPVGVYDVQMLSFPEKDHPQVNLGEYKDGVLTVLDGPLHRNAIVLYKTQDQSYQPVGFYENQGNIYVAFQNLPLFSSIVKAESPFLPSSPTEAKEQKYFVLENPYQQLVFTNVGGSLAEINLPFKSDKNSLSAVREIGFDRDILKQDPANAYFPSHPYYTYDSKQEHTERKSGGYYPLLRRDLVTPVLAKNVTIAPEYYSTNIVSDYPEMANMIYEVTEFTKDKITFVAKQPHRKITKTYTLKDQTQGAPYAFDLSIQIEGDGRGLWLTSGVPEVEIMSNNFNPQIQYRMIRKGKGDVEKLSLPKAQESVTISSLNPDWVSNSNGYFGVILNPLEEVGGGYKAKGISGNTTPTRLSILDPKYQPYKPSKYPGYQTLIPLPAGGGKIDFHVFAGPFEESTLKAVDKIYTDPVTGYNPSYISARTFYGWFSFISAPFAKILFVAMQFFYWMTHSWGFSIILLTVFLRIVLYPLNAWSFKATRRMQKLSPEVQAIQAKYKKDPKKAQMEIMKLYREKKVNPFTGCLPILIQIPFLVGMFDLLKSCFQLRGASFIPGWIDNLTAPDVLFSWNYPIFFIGTDFHLLPILLGAVMFLQQKVGSTAPKDPALMTDQQRQQRVMGIMMTIIFTVMFYHFPSGLNIYWLSSMLLGILQQWLTNRALDRKRDEGESAKKKKKEKAKMIKTEIIT
jgi:YidC/Oxa1 family membrane protein insertase